MVLQSNDFKYGRYGILASILKPLTIESSSGSRFYFNSIIPWWILLVGGYAA
jgi:hypothetical protein